MGPAKNLIKSSLPEIIPGSRLVLPPEVLELGERLFDQVEFGSIARKDQQVGACASGRCAHGSD